MDEDALLSKLCGDVEGWEIASQLVGFLEDLSKVTKSSRWNEDVEGWKIASQLDGFLEDLSKVTKFSRWSGDESCGVERQLESSLEDKTPFKLYDDVEGWEIASQSGVFLELVALGIPGESCRES